MLVVFILRKICLSCWYYVHKIFDGFIIQDIGYNRKGGLEVPNYQCITSIIYWIIINKNEKKLLKITLWNITTFISEVNKFEKA
jgi:hypothetical protein